jgi:hypothetical protein
MCLDQEASFFTTITICTHRPQQGQVSPVHPTISRHPRLRALSLLRVSLLRITRPSTPTGRLRDPTICHLGNEKAGVPKMRKCLGDLAHSSTLKRKGMNRDMAALYFYKHISTTNSLRNAHTERGLTLLSQTKRSEIK